MEQGEVHSRECGMGQGDHSRQSIILRQEQPPAVCSWSQERRGKTGGLLCSHPSQGSAGLVWTLIHSMLLAGYAGILPDVLESSQMCWSQEPLEHFTQRTLGTPCREGPPVPALPTSIPVLGDPRGGQE